jgi:hypothetical protein
LAPARPPASALHGLEGGPNGNLGFTKAHIAAHEPVHRPRLFHVRFCVLNRAQLVARFGVRKRSLEFLLPIVVSGEGMTGLRLARSVDAKEFRREVDRGPFGCLPRFLPATGADPAKLRAGFAQTDVAADQMRFLQGHVQRDLIVELQRDDFPHALCGVEFREAAEQRDAVLEMNDEVALHELGKIKQLVDLRALRDGARIHGRPPLPLTAENLGFGRYDQPGRGPCARAFESE